MLTLLASGISQREIARLTKLDRKTIRRIANGVSGPDPNSPTLATGQGTAIDYGEGELTRVPGGERYPLRIPEVSDGVGRPLAMPIARLAATFRCGLSAWVPTGRQVLALALPISWLMAPSRPWRRGIGYT